MRGATVVVLALVITTTALGTERKQDQTNIYDDALVREMSNEQVTALIKRHMANLLYPVDLLSFERPEKDGKFRDLIMALQRQMGVPTTGILTSDQFFQLGKAARDINASTPSVPPKLVYRADDGSWVAAVGTGAMDDIANPINVTRIICRKADQTCEMNIAEFDHERSFLSLAPPTAYQVATWTERRVTAILEHPCGTTTMSIDLIGKEATLVTVPHNDNASCARMGHQPSWTLVDGFPVSWNIGVNKDNKARELIYEPARKFFPPPRKSIQR